jgi:hypothetical protein
MTDINNPETTAATTVEATATATIEPTAKRPKKIRKQRRQQRLRGKSFRQSPMPIRNPPLPWQWEIRCLLGPNPVRKRDGGVASPNLKYLQQTPTLLVMYASLNGNMKHRATTRSKNSRPRPHVLAKSLKNDYCQSTQLPHTHPYPWPFSNSESSLPST